MFEFRGKTSTLSPTAKYATPDICAIPVLYGMQFAILQVNISRLSHINIYVTTQS